MHIAANPFVWIAAYLLWRVALTQPGRPPLDEDMTDDAH